MTSLRLATTRRSPRRPSRALDSSVPCNPGPRARPPPQRPRHPCRDDTRSTIIGSPGSRRHEEAHAAATGCGGTSCAAGPIGGGQFRGEAVRARVVAVVVVTPLRPPLPLCVGTTAKPPLAVRRVAPQRVHARARALLPGESRAFSILIHPLTSVALANCSRAHENTTLTTLAATVNNKKRPPRGATDTTSLSRSARVLQAATSCAPATPAGSLSLPRTFRLAHPTFAQRHLERPNGGRSNVVKSIREATPECAHCCLARGRFARGPCWTVDAPILPFRSRLTHSFVPYLPSSRRYLSILGQERRIRQGRAGCSLT